MENKNHDLLNIPVFNTDLFIPRYKDIEYKNWKIEHMGLGFDHGYFTDVWAVENMPILSRRNEDDPEVWESWMSICPHELESQELGCRYAYGETIVMGLGMGWIAINAALNKNVSKVKVIELDTEVIDLYNNCGATVGVPEEALDKIEIIHADAKEWRNEEGKTDFLYIDIWKHLVEPQTLDDVRMMQIHLNAEQIYFWGQELCLYNEMKEADFSDDEITNDTLRFLIENTLELPILIPDDIDYASLVKKAVQQRIKRRLPLKL